MLKREVIGKPNSGIEKNTILCDQKNCVHPATPKVDHPTAGDAADHARTVGYITRGEGIVDPMQWVCPACQKNLKSN